MKQKAIIDLPEKIKERVEKIEPLSLLVKIYGFANVIKALRNTYSEDAILKYIHEYCMKEFYAKRIIIHIFSFNLSFYGKNSSYLKYKDSNNKDLELKINKVIEEVYALEKASFVANNRIEMKLNSDFWRLCFLKGPALNKRDLDFKQIKSPTLRLEAKMYYKHILWYQDNFRNDRGFALLYAGLNIISGQYPNVVYLCDINDLHINYLITVLQTNEKVTQFNKKYSIESIRKMVQMIGMCTKFLMHIDNYQYAPKHNFAVEFQFHNSSSMSKNTEFIPECVIVELDKYYTEMNSNYQLIYRIMKETGKRIKEVLYLEDDCLTPSKVNNDYYVLEYTPYKIASKLKAVGKAYKQIVLVHTDLAKEIFKKIEETKTLRELSSSSYIFLTQRHKQKDSRIISLAQESNCVEAINRLIAKYNITDEGGKLWKYISRQARKTLAVNMAENGATSQEIANQLGHQSSKTTDIYYAEVRKKKLAELNSKLFKKRFNLYVGEKNLKLYSEEERRELYVDFAMNAREVEFGQCTKHVSDGPCGKRAGKAHCAICPKLCTGEKYLPKWVALSNSQLDIVNNLVSAYEKEKIEQYEDFIEYKREMKLLNEYQAVIDAIRKRRT